MLKKQKIREESLACRKVNCKWIKDFNVKYKTKTTRRKQKEQKEYLYVGVERSLAALAKAAFNS